MTQKNNPLMDFARKVECSVKLPSNGGWYDDDVVSFNALNEVNIMPMLPNDEMAVVNPETLVSGDAICQLIKSCCPTVHKPEELYYPDINTLLLGIKKATYGDELSQQYICPICWSKKNDLIMKEFIRIVKDKYGNDEVELSQEETEEIKKLAGENMKTIITDMERNEEICISPQEIKTSIGDILESITLLPTNGLVELKNGLKVYTTPYKCGEKIKFINKMIKYQKISKYITEQQKKYKVKQEFSEEYLDSLQGLTGLYREVAEINMDIIASSIKKIVTPSGDVVSERAFIYEFLKNSDVESVTLIRKKMEELNGYGVQPTIPCTCACCGYQWDEKFYGFNQNDFFGISS